VTAWSHKSPLAMDVIQSDKIPQTHKTMQVDKVCYIKTAAQPYKTRTVPAQCALLSNISLIYMFLFFFSFLLDGMRPVRYKSSRFRISYLKVFSRTVYMGIGVSQGFDIRRKTQTQKN
jgi:hypothetical protein